MRYINLLLVALSLHATSAIAESTEKYGGRIHFTAAVVENFCEADFQTLNCKEGENPLVNISKRQVKNRDGTEALLVVFHFK
ncbi:hypothetical protein [Serratia fonticola]